MDCTYVRTYVRVHVYPGAATPRSGRAGWLSRPSRPAEDELGKPSLGLRGCQEWLDVVVAKVMHDAHGVVEDCPKILFPIFGRAAAEARALRHKETALR